VGEGQIVPKINFRLKSKNCSFYYRPHEFEIIWEHAFGSLAITSEIKSENRITRWWWLVSRKHAPILILIYATCSEETIISTSIEMCHNIIHRIHVINFKFQRTICIIWYYNSQRKLTLLPHIRVHYQNCFECFENSIPHGRTLETILLTWNEWNLLLHF